MRIIKEKPRTRLVVLADLLGMVVKPSHTSRGGQVTKEFFYEVALTIGIPKELTVDRDKIGLCQLICNYMAVPFEVHLMTARGARITNHWFDAILARFDSIYGVATQQGTALTHSQLGRTALAGHLRTERTVPTDLDLGIEAFCYCCGDCAGSRLNYPVLEAHCTMPYLKSGNRLPLPQDFVAVCPACHKILHLRGIQAGELRRELRP
jgi:hypothetical protein